MNRLAEAVRRCKSFARTLRPRLSPSLRSWSAAAHALVAVWVAWVLAFALLEPFPGYAATSFVGVAGLFIWLGLASLGMILAGWLVTSLSAGYRAALFLALPPTFLSFMIIWGPAGGAAATAWLLTSVSLICGGGTAAARRHAKNGGRALALAVLGLGLLTAGGFIAALMWPPPLDGDPRQPLVAEPQDATALPDPSARGPHEIEAFTYGGGADRHRSEYAKGAKFISRPVDGTRLDRWSGLQGWLRTAYWGFDPTAFPIQARVWAPHGPGPFPLVLIVHGNHEMHDFSDAGYAYLGEHLASHGFISVSVDENFLNSGLSDFVELLRLREGQENDARAWLLLEHLVQWRAWTADVHHPLYGKADMDRIALIGHSRGGEAVVTAAAFNRLAAYPDDATLPFRYGFPIRAVVALAPSDRQYQPRRRPSPLRDVSYFVIQGSMDGDMTSFAGSSQYARAVFSPGSDAFKASLYIKNANHGQFNTGWGRNDLGRLLSFWLEDRPIMDPDDQRQVLRVFATAFLHAAMNGREPYRRLMASPRAAAPWLPSVTLIGNYQDDRTSWLATYEEDLDPTTGSAPGVEVAGHNLSVWREVDPKLKDHQLGSFVAIIGWDRRMRLPSASYALSFTAPHAAPYEGALVFAAADAAVDTLPEGFEAPKDETGAPQTQSGLDWTVTLVDADGDEARLPLSRDEKLFPQIQGRTRRAPWLDGETVSELVMRRYRFPLADFAQANPELDLSHLRAVRFDFDRSPQGAIALDDVGLSPGL